MGRGEKFTYVRAHKGSILYDIHSNMCNWIIAENVSLYYAKLICEKLNGVKHECNCETNVGTTTLHKKVDES